ncbi:MAG: alkaline phosphatase family protein [Candidatus Bathyarchaeum sp.]|nr:MAG: alkaline phosphatase family protein [Candidatus Bathyarchaeum sp.]
MGLGTKITGKTEGFKKLERKTWVDNPNVKEIGVPYYSYTNEFFQLLRDFEENKDLTYLRRKFYWLFRKQTTEVVSKTKALLREAGKIDVVFAYIHFPDLLNHVWYTDKDRLKKFYVETNEFVGHLKAILKETHLLLISDHGFDFTKNDHSDFGFISSNKEMKFPKSIIELGKQVKRYQRKSYDETGGISGKIHIHT